MIKKNISFIKTLITITFFTIIAIIDNGLNSYKEKISLTIQLVSIVESTLQSILIINALKMFSKDKQTKKSKPARSLITLLILIKSKWLLSVPVMSSCCDCKTSLGMDQWFFFFFLYESKWFLSIPVMTGCGNC